MKKGIAAKKEKGDLTKEFESVTIKLHKIPGYEKTLIAAENERAFRTRYEKMVALVTTPKNNIVQPGALKAS
ncbi:MAG: hypothetical protein V1721_06130 [Pseudomonadota bacterium]